MSRAAKQVTPALLEESSDLFAYLFNVSYYSLNSILDDGNRSLGIGNNVPNHVNYVFAVLNYVLKDFRCEGRYRRDKGCYGSPVPFDLGQDILA